MSVSTKLFHLDKILFSSFRRLRLQLLGVKVGKNLNLGRNIKVFKDNHSRMVVGDNCSLGEGMYLYAINGGEIEIKRNVRIDHNASLFSRAGRISIDEGTIISSGAGINSEESVVELGKNVLIAPHVDIMNRDHKFNKRNIPIKDQGQVSKSVKIEDDCWIGIKCTVLKGVKIGKGSLIGANSVVTKNIPAYSIAVGAPAKVIKKR